MATVTDLRDLPLPPEGDLRASHTDLAGKTYRVLRDLIVTRALGPGEKITAEGLAQRFGVSRTTVKTALDQLALEGLVIVRPQVGTFVRGLSARDVHEIWETRALIETYAARRGAPRATEAQRRELHAIVEAMRPLVQQDEYREEHYPRVVELDRRFHELVVETAGNDFLLGLHRQAALHIHTVSYASLRAKRGLRRASAALAEHAAVAEAYEQRDGERAAAVLARHIERSRQVALQALDRAEDVL
jgi:DNA-binding GntR family transcriptional regulator